MVQMFGTTWCGDCHRSRKVLESLGIEFKWVDVDQDANGLALVVKVAGKRKVPVLVFPDGSTLVEPSDRDLTRKVQEAGLVPRSEAH